ncbi:uncharacterized protein B0H18DRAFT_964618 [Fomitopsis serialis]|uniref:uncharacterized protein n=1 Tax=Fomitopsis serialis TaxID=139415 RepID=UPI00200753D3|nr:uncharacterized protein B0H18DRAFT_964618 [Neoantrodia serialis]KAH9907112.1 hypothetical protein B0H18DRAFT_964618 [Neoantrodia serialis]
MADANLHRLVQTTSFDLVATPGYHASLAKTPFDVKCAADAEDDCNIFTSPFANWVPEFPRIVNREIVTYSDGFWGPQEYTRWPQLYNESCIHHACIPNRDAEFAPGAQVYDGFGYSPWEESAACGVPGFGFLKPNILDEMFTIASGVLTRYEAAERHVEKRDSMLFNRESGIHHRLGRMLSILLRNAVDRLQMLPSTEQHALVTGRMAHRLILELSGLTVFYKDVVVRMSASISHHRWVLPVLGAFVRTEAAAQLSIVWAAILAHPAVVAEIKITEVVKPRRWNSVLSDKPAWPRVPKSWYDPDGTHQDPGRWTHPSVIFVCNMTCSSALPHLQAVRRAEEKDTRRNATKRGKRGRSKRGGAKAHAPHAATTFKCPPEDLVAITPNWRAALSGVAPLAFPPASPSSTTIHRRSSSSRPNPQIAHRLVDSRINGAPLRIADWRHALFGDYHVDRHGEASESHVKEVEEGELGSDEDDRHPHGTEGDGRVESGRTFCARNENRQSDLYSPKAELFSPIKKLMSYDIVLATRDHQVLRFVTWELYETNWRCEIRALDSRLVDQTSDSFRKWEREQLLAEVWRDSSVQSAFSASMSALHPLAGSPLVRWLERPAF